MTTEANSSEATAERRRQALRAYTERLADNVGATAPDTAVPTCPGWTVSDLAAHVGETLNWVSEIIERRISDPTRAAHGDGDGARRAGRLARMAVQGW